MKKSPSHNLNLGFLTSETAKDYDEIGQPSPKRESDGAAFLKKDEQFHGNLISKNQSICSNRSLLMNRYPAIGFAFLYTSYTPFEIFEDDGWLNAFREGEYLYSKGNIEKECEKWFKSLDLKSVDVLCIYGLGLGLYFDYLKDWLSQSYSNNVLFIEDDFAVLDAFIKTSKAEILQNPQVHLKFVNSKREWKQVYQDINSLFLNKRLKITALKSYLRKGKKSLSQIKRSLYSRKDFIDVRIKDLIGMDKIYDNFLSNCKKLNKSFNAAALKDKFKNIPMVICGAGPSLEKSKELLSQIENKALIVAAGSSIPLLSKYSINPHFGIAVDPNYNEYKNLKQNQNFEMPLLYASRVYHKVFNTFNGPNGFLHLRLGVTSGIEEDLDLHYEIPEPFKKLSKDTASVTALALSLAPFLGCNPIILVGVDLAFTDNRQYADGVLSFTDNSILKNTLKRKDKFKNLVLTSKKWSIESRVIGDFAKKYKELSFIDSTDGGIGFKGIPYIPFNEVVDRFCNIEYDLRAKIHAEIQLAKIEDKVHFEIKEYFSKLTESLLRCSNFCQEMLDEINKALLNAEQIRPNLRTGKMVLLEMEIYHEKAFKLIFEGFPELMEKIFSSNKERPLDPKQIGWKKFYLENFLNRWLRLEKIIGIIKDQLYKE